jgi:hypothetical protein
MPLHTAVFALFPDRLAVESAIDALRSSGFDSDDISVLLPDHESPHDLAHAKASKAPEGATAGVGAGAMIGGALGWLAGIGSLALPGIGPLIAAGPIVAALATASVVGAVGGIAGALLGMGIPEYEAKRYEGHVRAGGILLSVHCDDMEAVRRAKEILDAIGGRDIASATEEHGHDGDWPSRFESGEDLRDDPWPHPYLG